MQHHYRQRPAFARCVCIHAHPRGTLYAFYAGWTLDAAGRRKAAATRTHTTCVHSSHSFQSQPIDTITLTVTSVRLFRCCLLVSRARVVHSDAQSLKQTHTHTRTDVVRDAPRCTQHQSKHIESLELRCIMLCIKKWPPFFLLLISFLVISLFMFFFISLLGMRHARTIIFISDRKWSTLVRLRFQFLLATLLAFCRSHI